MKYRRECIFRPLEKKEKRRKGCASSKGNILLLIMSRAEYIESLERRLVEMESLLRSSGLLEEAKDLQSRESRLGRHNGRDEAQKSETALLGSPASSNPISPKQSLLGDPSVSKLTGIMTSRERRKEVEPGSREGPAKDDIETLSDKMCSLMTNKCGEAKYIGSCWRSNCVITLTDSCRLIIRLFQSPIR
jgi:hypothetical protein